MIDAKRKQQAESNFRRYIEEGLLKKETNVPAMSKYLENADLSLKTANELMQSQEKPHLWVIVISYYSMFYMANAILLKYGYKTQAMIAHKVTSDALIVLVLDRLKSELLEDYEMIQKDALEIAGSRAETVIESYDQELDKRSRFQYDMLEAIKESKARTSFKRASEFVFELRKLMRDRRRMQP